MVAHFDRGHGWDSCRARTTGAEHDSGTTAESTAGEAGQVGRTVQGDTPTGADVTRTSDADDATAAMVAPGTGRRSGARARIALHEAGTLTDDELAKWRRFWEELLRVRLVSGVVLATFVVLLPAIGPYRVPVGIAVGLGITVANLIMLVAIRHGRSVGGAIAATDLTAIVAVMTVVPATYAPGTILLVALAAFFLFWFRGRTAALLLVPLGVALGAIGWWRQPELWFPIWLSWTATCALSAVAIGRMSEFAADVGRRYDDLVNGIDAVLWEANGPIGDAAYVSDRIEALLGYSPQEMARFSFLASRVHPEDLDDLIASRRRIADGDDVELGYRVRDARGRFRHVHERVRVTLDHAGRVLRRRGVLVDDTDGFEAQRWVRSYVDFIEGIPVALTILRLDDLDDPRSLKVVVGNPAAADLAGTTVADATGTDVVELFPEADVMLERLADVVRLATSLEHPFMHIHGRDEVFAMRAVPLPDQCVGVSLEDVTKRARLAESLRHQAMHDHLTGLPNRARFNERLGRALGDDESGSERLAVAVMDLNRFKEVNDSLGHEYGDLLLTALARRFARGLRGCDTIARLGGDEFAVLVTHPADDAAVLAVAQRLVELCEEPVEIEGMRLQVGASVGVAVAPEHGTDATTILRHADAAMYRAKESGGGIVLHSEAGGSERASDATDELTKVDLVDGLRTATLAEELVLHYQPRIDLDSMAVTGVEALVRWHHPRYGMLPPAAFIELAEVSGTIDQLSRAVTERALAEIAPLVGTVADPHLSLDVNLSGRNLADPRLLDWVIDVLSRSEFDPSGLRFELGENDLAADPARSLEVLHRLRHLGVRLGVDDFGTGSSSLPALRELPIDEVKIDRRFVADLAAGDDTVVRSVIDLAHNLDLDVVAEGVEDAGTLRTLRALGCDGAQGFHLAAPMPLDDLRQFLGAHPSAPMRAGRPQT